MVDDGDPIGQLVRLLEVLRGQQQRRALADELPHRRPDLIAAAGIESSRGLVEEQDSWPGQQARGEIKPAARPARVGPCRAVGRVGELELRQQFVGSLARLGLGEAEQAAEHEEVLSATEDLVDRGKLSGQPQHLADGVGVSDDVAAEHLGSARVWLEQRGKHTNKRRLAGPIGAEERKDRSLGYLEVDPGEGRSRTEALDDAVDANGDGRVGAHAHTEATILGSAAFAARRGRFRLPISP